MKEEKKSFPQDPLKVCAKRQHFEEYIDDEYVSQKKFKDDQEFISKNDDTNSNFKTARERLHAKIFKNYEENSKKEINIAPNIEPNIAPQMETTENEEENYLHQKIKERTLGRSQILEIIQNDGKEDLEDNKFYVRYLIGNKEYELCKIIKFKKTSYPRIYGGMWLNTDLLVKIGNQTCSVLIPSISNEPPTSQEIQDYLKAIE